MSTALVEEKPNGEHKPSTRLLSFEIGQRVRGLRRKYGLTRRELAETTAISERYLGQLENGQANASINILHKIASRFDETVGFLIPSKGSGLTSHQALSELLSSLNEGEQAAAYELLRTRFTNGHTERKGIAMIGMRGAGKSTLGEQLSELTEVPFVRLSQVVVDRAGLEASEIMELWGPAAFRRFEYEALSELIEEPGKIILETSGGIVGGEAGFNLLMKHFRTVWLKAEPDEHMQRVIDQNDLRPITGRTAAMEDLVAILREREPGYRRADHVLTTSGRSTRDCLAELLDVSKPVICV